MLARTAILALTLGALALPAVAPALRNDSAPDPSIADGSAQRALDAARASWRAYDGRGHYRLTISFSCFCTPEAFQPHRVEVRAGRPVARPPRDVRRYATVRRLFARVQDAIDQRVAQLTVRYDRHGVPRELDVDVSFMIADEEHGTHVRFRALD